MKYFGIIFFLASHLTFYGQKLEKVFRSWEDSTQNTYVALIPDSSIKGLLVILPGFGTYPEEVLKETKIPATACVDGYLVIIPLLLSYDIEDKTNVYESRLESLITELFAKYRIPKNKFVIGGHSIGGHQALFYAEQTFRFTDKSNIRPSAAFGVDPPLDKKRAWESYQYNIKINFSKVSVDESKYMSQRYIDLYGGSPLENPSAYADASSFFRDAADGGNAKYLRTLPLRLYSDPDINWFIDNRLTPIELTNTADLSACIIQLKLLGNIHAEYVSCLGRGFQDGKRHPHGFSMVDANEFVKWIDSILYEK